MNWFIFIFLSFIFVLSPYQKGLYFDYDFYGIHLLIYSLFVVLFIRLLVRKELEQLKSVWFVMLIPLIYLLTVFWASSPLGAWNTALRWISYVSFFFLLYWSALRKVNVQKLLPVVFHTTGIWIAIHMILNQFQVLNYPNAFIMGRFAGVFQYPNTFGMAMIVFYLFSLMMLLREKSNVFYQIFYSFPLVLFFTCFIESYSRGMYIAAPIAWFLGLVLLRPSKQLIYIVYTVFTGLSGLMLSKLIHADDALTGILFIIVLSALIVLLVVFVNRPILATYFDRAAVILDKKVIYRVIAPLIIVIFSMILVVDISYQGYIYKQLPENIQERVVDMGESSTARERKLFMEDAMKISSDSPLIGHGGNAWESLYRKYQQLPYRSKLIHNGYLEILLDVGWVGLMVVFGTLGLLYFYVIRNFLRVEDKIPIIAVLISTTAMLIHSFIDFNMAFGTFWLILFWLLVIGLLPEGEEAVQFKQPKIIAGYGLISFFLLVLVGTFYAYRFMHGEQLYRQAKSANTLMEKELYLNEAILRNPYQDRYLYSLADTHIKGIKNGDNISIREEKVSEIGQLMSGLEPNNSLILSNAGHIMNRIVKKDQALAYYQQALSVDSFDISIYEKVLSLTIDLALERKKLDDRYNIEQDARYVVATYEQLVVDYQDFTENPIGKAHNSRDFHMSDSLISSAAAGYLLLNESDMIKDLLAELPDESEITNELIALIILAYEKAGEQKKAQKFMKETSQNEEGIEEYLLQMRKRFDY